MTEYTASVVTLFPGEATVAIGDDATATISTLVGLASVETADELVVAFSGAAAAEIGSASAMVDISAQAEVEIGVFIGPQSYHPTTTTTSFVGIAAGQTVTLAGTPTGFRLLIVNGLVQDASSYGVTTNHLVIPPGLVWDGADCAFIYQT